MMKLAILYQAQAAPAVEGAVKPKKEGGYSDSGADIACSLKEAGHCVVTPAAVPDPARDLDWVFPDTAGGIRQAVGQGADVLWLNTVLYAGHPITGFRGQSLRVIGQNPEDAGRFDDKFFTNSLLEQQGVPMARRQLLHSAREYSGAFPAILKPVRGRGSQGVCYVQDARELAQSLDEALACGRYGSVMLAEEYLSGREVTVSLFPDGTCLPAVERFHHVRHIAPYSGVVAVAENSCALLTVDGALKELYQACRRAVSVLRPRALIRIDCRQGDDGRYRLFDVNLKPNMTGPSRPHRQNQSSLTALAAGAAGLSYAALLERLAASAWEL